MEYCYPPLGPIEKQFLRHVLLGESIAPYRVIATPLAVIPFDGKILLDSTTATAKGHRHLARWLRDIETKWGEHAARKLDRSLRISLRQRLDFMRGLTGQFPVSELRVVYPQSGTLLCAAVLGAGEIVEHKAYWASARSRDEANYLVAILNAEEVRRRIAAMQSKGQGGARDFDLLPFELKIPEFTSQDPLHLALAAAAAHAEKIAASVPLDPAAYFTINRRTIREALIADGIAARIETLVTQLLPPYAP